MEKGGGKRSETGGGNEKRERDSTGITKRGGGERKGEIEVEQGREG